MTVLVLVLTFAAAAGLAQQAATPPAAPSPAPTELAALWDREHVSSPVSPLVDHREVVRRLGEMRRQSPDLYSVEEVGRSVEGRSVNLVTAGDGAFRVLLWSQMHGDEPTATSALFDLFEYLRRHRAEPVASRILENLTLYAIPMLNPDGAERFQRRNAQGIDINRDALLLQSPEAQTLKRIRDRYEPNVGFNLHNQSWRTSVGRTPPRPASISLLSVAFDEARTQNEGRLLTKKTCAVIRDALEPIAPGQIGRYDDEFEVRAFGDNITLWGTPVLLIETGPFPAREPDPALVRLNFVAILTSLDALATGRVHQADPGRYESLPENDSRMFHTLIRQASIVTGSGIAPFTGDIGVTATRRVRMVDGQRRVSLAMGIEDLGDLRVFSGLEEIDARGMVVAPLFAPNLVEGTEIKIPAGLKVERPLGAGQPAAFVLLQPGSIPGNYRILRIVKGD